MKAQELNDAMRAGIVAHLIRLGKRPSAGMTVDFLANIKSGSEEDFQAGRIDKFRDTTKPQRLEFTVTQRDIDNAITLINEQKAQYREPKLTSIRLDNK